MSEGEMHPSEALQAFLDGCLEGEQRRAVERHLASCARCRSELSVLRWTRDRVGDLARAPVPPGLTERLRAALDAEDAGRARGGLPRWLPLAAAALVVALVAVPLWWSGRTDPVAKVRADLASVAAGDLPLEAVGLAPAQLERWFAGRGVPFETRVFDLSPMAWELAGGRVGTVGGETSALYAYRGPEDALVVCQMYRGSLPARDDASREIRVRDDGLEFVIVRREGAVLVFWLEGGVVCVLASEDLNAEEVLALAYAKAVRST